MEKNKSVLVIGAGAIGGYVGGSLAAAGHRVGFLCRARTASVLRADGLTLRAPERAYRIEPEVHESAAEALESINPDLVILAVKRYDTASAISPFQTVSRKLPPILELQNGIGASEDLQDLLTGGEIISGTVTTAVGRPNASEIVVERFRGIGIAGPHPAARTWAGLLEDAGLGARYYETGAEMKWSKLVTNLIANPVSAICDLPPSEIFAHRGLFRLEMMQLREALAVMRALGVRVVDLPGTPVRMLAFAAQYMPLPLAQPLLGRILAKGRGGKMPSFHGDLHGGGGKSEVGYLHGAVVRAGEQVGTRVDVNRMLSDTLTAMIEGNLDPNLFRQNPDRLLAQLD